MNPNFFLLALIIGLHFEPAWALLLIVIALFAKIFPFAVALEIVGPMIISAINRHRRQANAL